jgi:hypothetical protein
MSPIVVSGVAVPIFVWDFVLELQRRRRRSDTPLLPHLQRPPQMGYTYQRQGAVRRRRCCRARPSWPHRSRLRTHVDIPMPDPIISLLNISVISHSLDGLGELVQRIWCLFGGETKVALQSHFHQQFCEQNL